MPNLVIRHIVAHKTTDSGDDDLVVNTRTDGGAFTERWEGNISGGPIGYQNINLTFGFTNNIEVYLYDQDSNNGRLDIGDDDIIGHFQARTTDVGTGEKKQWMYQHGSKYEITWRVD
jgi:hypothetical protein